MPTNLTINYKQIEKARETGKHKTKNAAVTEALEEYIQRRNQSKIIKLFGTIDYDDDYDHKEQRKKE